MANDSSTGGYLAPADAPAPEEDADLDAIFQSAVVGITGLPGNLVRPRWQPGNPKQPEPSVDWCAIGVMGDEADDGPAITHHADGEGSDEYVRHEEIEVLASFYGPRGKSYAKRLRDGIAMPQNVEGLQTSALAFVEARRIRSAPEFFNQQWIRRYDLPLRFRRKVTRVYQIKNVLSADIHLLDDTHIDETITVPPAP